MNKDIRLVIGFCDHPKTIKLVRRLGEESIRYLLRLWLWAAQNRPDGNLKGMDAEDIEIAAGWAGENKQLFEALISVKFLDASSKGFALHNWEEHQGWACHAEERSQRAKQAAEIRWKARNKNKEDKEKKCGEHANSNADSMPNACGEHTSSNAPSPDPLPPPFPFPDPDLKKNNIKKNLAQKPDDVTEQTWADFQTLRKAKKAPLTVKALEGIIAEAVKANWNLDRALTECCARGWQGFKAAWVKEDPAKQNYHGTHKMLT